MIYDVSNSYVHYKIRLFLQLGIWMWDFVMHSSRNIQEYYSF